MNGLCERLELVKLDIGDQADYVQILLEQYDLPYDACCGLQVAVDDLKSLAERIRFLLATMPKTQHVPTRPRLKVKAKPKAKVKKKPS